MIPCVTEKKLSHLKNLLGEAERITVLVHTHPDGDAIGSATAMCSFLKECMGKSPVCILPDTAPEQLKFIIPDDITFFFADKELHKAQERIAGAELIILIDCNGFSRTEQLAGVCSEASARKILIDHHLNPQQEEFDLVFSTPDVSSASELLFWILRGLHKGDLPQKAREALLAGMTTDTNNFSNSVFPSTFEMASWLIAAGTDRDTILGCIYNSYRENRIRLMGYMQSHEMHITPEGAAYMVMTKEIQDRFGYLEGETEGLVNVPLAIGKVRLSILATESSGTFRISIRSKKGTSAQRMAADFFHGGGHENAAGGKIIIGEDIASPAEAPSHIKSIVKTFFAQ